MNSVMEAISCLQAVSPSERMKYTEAVKKQFKMDANEKWVMTRLRMMLFRMKANFESYQFQTLKMRSPEKKRNMKKTTQRKSSTNLRKNVVLGRSAKKVTHYQSLKKKRQSLEERQLSKLRSQKFCEKNDKKSTELFRSQKLEFLSSLNVIPRVVTL